MEIAWKKFLKTFFLKLVEKNFEDLLFWRTLAPVFLASTFFCVLGLEPCVLDSTSASKNNICIPQRKRKKKVLQITTRNQTRSQNKFFWGEQKNEFGLKMHENLLKMTFNWKYLGGQSEILGAFSPLSTSLPETNNNKHTTHYLITVRKNSSSPLLEFFWRRRQIQ